MQAGKPHVCAGLRITCGAAWAAAALKLHQHTTINLTTLAPLSGTRLQPFAAVDAKAVHVPRPRRQRRVVRQPPGAAAEERCVHRVEARGGWEQPQVGLREPGGGQSQQTMFLSGGRTRTVARGTAPVGPACETQTSAASAARPTAHAVARSPTTASAFPPHPTPNGPTRHALVAQQEARGLQPLLQLPQALEHAPHRRVVAGLAGRKAGAVHAVVHLRFAPDLCLSASASQDTNGSGAGLWLVWQSVVQLHPPRSAREHMREGECSAPCRISRR